MTKLLHTARALRIPLAALLASGLLLGAVPFAHSADAKDTTITKAPKTLNTSTTADTVPQAPVADGEFAGDGRKN